MTLSSTEIQDLQSRLEAQRTGLLAALHERLHQGDEPSELALANFWESIGDRAEAGLLAHTDIAQLSHEVAELAQVDAALARVQAGSYGRCSACGEPIVAARLRAQPMAAMCIDCQQASERHR